MITACVLHCCLLPQCEALRACRARTLPSTFRLKSSSCVTGQGEVKKLVDSDVIMLFLFL